MAFHRVGVPQMGVHKIDGLRWKIRQKCMIEDGLNGMLREFNVSINAGSPKWTVYFMEHPKQKCMMTGATPHDSGNPPYL